MVEVMHLMSRMAETASEDDQTVREAVRDAMFLYLSLPQSARRALRALSAIGGDEEREAIAQAAASAIVRAGFHAARRTGASGAGVAYPNGKLATEEDVEAEAVRLTSAAYASLG
jgi:hypothetical protein